MPHNLVFLGIQFLLTKCKHLHSVMPRCWNTSKCMSIPSWRCKSFPLQLCRIWIDIFYVNPGWTLDKVSENEIQWNLSLTVLPHLLCDPLSLPWGHQHRRSIQIRYTWFMTLPRSLSLVVLQAMMTHFPNGSERGPSLEAYPDRHSVDDVSEFLPSLPVTHISTIVL
jgi:hypothetical protein